MPIDLSAGVRVAVHQPSPLRVTGTVPTSRAVVVPVRGPAGADGTGGAAGGPEDLVAGHILSGHRLVVPDTGDAVVYADHDTLSDLGRPIWLTLGAAAQGAPVDLAWYGTVTESSWSWTLGPIYVGDNGLLTQTPPTSGYSRQIGAAIDSNTIWLDPQLGIALS